jgi:RPA family protein
LEVLRGMNLEEPRKRNIAYKLRIGDVMKAKPMMNEGKLLFLESGDRKIIRVNVIANVVDKFLNAGEKKYISLTLDDASGQIRLKAFGDDVAAIENYTQGDTLQIIGFVREYNSELYITPEVVKKVDPRWLLVRKLEVQKTREELPVKSDGSIREVLMEKIKAAEKENGINVDTLIMEIETAPDLINQEIVKLLEEGLIYEPRPGRLRYLG